MVYFRADSQKNPRYLKIYHGDKCLKYLGRIDKLTPEKLAYHKAYWEEKIRREKELKKEIKK